MMASFCGAQAPVLEGEDCIDVTRFAKTMGFRGRVAVSAGAWRRYVQVPDVARGAQTETGRLWNILWTAQRATRSGGGAPSVSLSFFCTPSDAERPDAILCALTAISAREAGEQSSLTILLPTEI